MLKYIKKIFFYFLKIIFEISASKILIFVKHSCIIFPNISMFEIYIYIHTMLIRNKIELVAMPSMHLEEESTFFFP